MILSIYGRRLLAALTCALLLTLAAGPAPAAETATTLADLPRLAESGRFDEVLARLQADPQASNDPAATVLLNDLKQHISNDQRHTASRHEAYIKALTDMKEQVQQGDLEDALRHAIEANGLADDPHDMLKDPAVTALVDDANAAASTAQNAGDWLRALELYRALALLYEEQPQLYRAQVDTTIRHLRLLRMYGPTELKRLYTLRSQRLDSKINREKDPKVRKDLERLKKDIDEADLDEETWQDKLARIEMPMLKQSIYSAARSHVAGQGYAPLLRGALDAMLTMIDSRGLAETFPAFKDRAKVEAFRDSVLQLRKPLDDPNRAKILLGYDSNKMLDEVMAANIQTLGLPESVVVFEMADGAMARLDDFSSIIWPEELEQFARNTKGTFYGVGIQIARRDGRLMVMSPLAGTPAQKAGIRAGDIIAKVEGKDTSSWSLDRAVREITGPQGTPVTLSIERPGAADLLDFAIKRAEIVIESIRGWQYKPNGTWDYFVDPENHIGYVRLSQFIPQTAGDLDAAINQMEETGLNALIIDLRFNPGGLLNSARDVADRFLESGTIVSTVAGNGMPTAAPLRARPDRTQRNFPIVVLINQGSASASEIVSGALQDYSRALIVGSRSFGKGSVQDIFELDNKKAQLKLTTQYYLLPKGRRIHRTPESTTWGIEPDLKVPMTDAQVAEALEFRQKIDVLPGGAPAAAVANDGKAEPEPAPTAEQLISKGLDPQLETAVLVLKTRLVTRQISLARGQQKVATP